MDYKAMLALCLPLSIGIAAFGSAMGLGKAVAASVESTGRQPEASTKILICMLVGCALIEALTIYVLFFAFSMAGRI